MFQVKVDNKEECNKVIDILIEMGYYIKNKDLSVENYKMLYSERIKYVIVNHCKTINGNWPNPFMENIYPIISYQDFIVKCKYPYYGEYKYDPELIVKFTEPSVGIVVQKNKRYSVGEKYKTWIEEEFNKIDFKGENTIMKKGNFIIGSIDKKSGEVSFAAHPKAHSNFLSASNEAERLAKTNRSKKYVVVEIKGICQVDDVIWE